MTRSNRRLSTGFFCSLALSLGLLSASDAAVVAIGNTNVPAGQSFTVPLTVSLGNDVLGSCDVTVSYNTNLLLATNVTNGSGQIEVFTPNFDNPGVISILAQNTDSFSAPTGLVTIANITFIATGPGGSNATLTVSVNELVNPDVVNISFTTSNGVAQILDVPTAAFTGSPTSGGPPLPVTFTDTSSGTITNRFWNFGDGMTTNTTSTSVPHTYTGVGTYTVNLTVFGSLGSNTLTRTSYITVVGAPTANFTGSPTSGTASLMVTFSDNSTGSITNRFWNFGDGMTTNTTSTSVPHTYNSAGTYTVTLTVSGPGGQNFFSRASYVVVTNIPAILNVTPASRNFGSVNIGQTTTQSFQVANLGQLTLNGTVTVSAPFSILSGTPFNLAGGATGTVNVAFTPVVSGGVTNTVVFSSNGGSSSNQVTGTGVMPAMLGVNPSNINFGAVTTGAFAQANFVVTNKGAIALSGTATVLGGPFSIQSGTPFNIPGFSSANVLVRFSPVSVGGVTNSVAFSSNGGGSTNAVIGQGVAMPVAGFTANPTNGTVSLLVTFTDASTGTITNRLWMFGDGGTSSAMSPTHTYTNPGVYSVSLTVFGPGGSNTLTKSNHITVTSVQPPVADFSADPTNGTAPLLVNFTDASTGTITNRHWDFGDGGTSSLMNPSHTYTNPGVYSVSLMVAGPSGSNELSQVGLITVLGTADLELTKIGSASSVLLNSNLTYTLTVINHGPDTASAVTITDTLPVEVVFSVASPECTESNGVVACSLGILNSGESTNVTITVVAADIGTATNLAAVSAAEFDPNLSNNVAGAVTTISDLPPTVNCALAPQTATNLVGSMHAVVATVTTNGAPAEAVAVDFEVISGPNAGSMDADVTDAIGEATFQYAGNGGAGTDIIQATGTVAGNAFTCTATKVWLPLDIGCSLAPAQDTNQVGTIHTVVSTITTNGNPATSVTVHFQVVSGPNVGANGNGATDGNGKAAFQYTGSGSGGTDTIMATGIVSTTSFSCEATKVWVVGPCPELGGTWSKVKFSCKEKDGVVTCKLSGKLGVLNSGVLPTGQSVLVRYFLAEDQAHTVYTEIGQSTVKPIAVGKTGKAKLKAALTNNNPAGKFLFAVINADSAISECDETNNVVEQGPLQLQ